MASPPDLESRVSDKQLQRAEKVFPPAWALGHGITNPNLKKTAYSEVLHRALLLDVFLLHTKFHRNLLRGLEHETCGQIFPPHYVLSAKNMQ